MTIPVEFAWVATGVALALLGWGAWSSYAVWVELRGIAKELRRLAKDQGKLAADQRGLRQQLSNLLSMLLRAGFKRGPARDWSDDEQATQVRGEGTETQWDWRRPDAG